MTTKGILLVLLSTALTGCEFHCSVGNTDSGTTSKTVSSTDTGGLTGAVLKNDIELEANDVKVSWAFLHDEAGNMLDSGNVVGLGEKVTCAITADTGWTKIEGRSFIGASEKIIGSDGTVMLDAKDLFEAYDATGVSEEDGKFINIRAKITEKLPNVDDYTVQFRVWDKKGKGEIKGKFKFRVK